MLSVSYRSAMSTRICSFRPSASATVLLLSGALEPFKPDLSNCVKNVRERRLDFVELLANGSESDEAPAVAETSAQCDL